MGNIQNLMHMLDLEIATAAWQLKLLTHPIVMVGWEGIFFQNRPEDYRVTLSQRLGAIGGQAKAKWLNLTVTKKKSVPPCHYPVPYHSQWTGSSS